MAEAPTINLTEDGKLQKKILKEGTGEELPQNG